MPLTCILTMKDNERFYKMLDIIKENKELLDIFDNQSNIWWNSDGKIDFIRRS